MKVGVLSDTHLYDLIDAQRLADKLLSGPFADVDAILHAGDAVINGLDDCFAPIPWYAVRGNMDHSLNDLPVSRIVKLASKQIGMVHGWGAAQGIEQRVAAHFMGQSIDVVIFGHSHQPYCRRIGSVLLFNPGSATDRRKAQRHTVGVLTLGEEVSGEIIPID